MVRAVDAAPAWRRGAWRRFAMLGLVAAYSSFAVSLGENEGEYAILLSPRRDWLIDGKRDVIELAEFCGVGGCF